MKGSNPLKPVQDSLFALRACKKIIVKNQTLIQRPSNQVKSFSSRLGSILPLYQTPTKCYSNFLTGPKDCIPLIFQLSPGLSLSVNSHRSFHQSSAVLFFEMVDATFHNLLSSFLKGN